MVSERLSDWDLLELLFGTKKADWWCGETCGDIFSFPWARSCLCGEGKKGGGSGGLTRSQNWFWQLLSQWASEGGTVVQTGVPALQHPSPKSTREYSRILLTAKHFSSVIFCKHSVRRVLLKKQGLCYREISIWESCSSFTCSTELRTQEQPIQKLEWK